MSARTPAAFIAATNADGSSTLFVVFGAQFGDLAEAAADRDILRFDKHSSSR